jgi:UDP-N-acetylmuramyl pentapeptide phosphotransferase/UDP-N-acetylglucosamine-1-phosphate transferase
MFCAINVYFFIARRFNIYDKPNDRSSHAITTLRGGGVIFYLGVIYWFFLSGCIYTWFFLGLTLISLISFLDDFKSVGVRLRLVAHFVSVLFLLFQLTGFNSSIGLIVMSVIVSVGIINVFNFMDGINGMTGLYSLSVLASLWFINSYQFFFVENSLIYSLALLLVIFNFYNVRSRAKCFAGDIGSVSIAFILLFIIGKLIVLKSDWFYLILLLVYGVDSTLTIIHRLVNKEDIFMPHRKHVYQLLVNELNFSHVKVSGVYAFIQLIITVAFMFFENSVNRYAYLVSVTVLLVVIYFLIKSKVKAVSEK